VAEQRPDILLLNISMPGLNGFEVARRVVKDHPRTRVIICSLHADIEYVRRALALGAAGYLLKSSPRAELELAIRAVERGDVWLTPSVSKSVVAALVRGEDPGEHWELLTPRQREVLQLVSEGHSSKEIAYRLGLSTKTVESHRAQLMKRLGVHSTAELLRSATRLRLLPSEI